MSADPESLGRRVKAARALLDMSAEQLAHALGVSDQTVYDLENGERPTKEERLLALERVLRQPRAWLLGGKGPPSTPLDGDVAHLAEYDRRLGLLEEAELAREKALRDLRRQLERIARRLEAAEEALSS
jgi:transcriptional regulator with XRE-family HTH domain